VGAVLRVPKHVDNAVGRQGNLRDDQHQVLHVGTVSGPRLTA
jgi:hypothetical protein